jgi:triosephosphate isomerase
MRTPLIAGNWKMFKTVNEAVAFTAQFHALVAGITDVEIVVAPPFTALQAVAAAARGTNIGVSAQDVYFEREGAFTGEISVGMLREAGAAYTIVGHSERRRLFGETDAIVNRKAAAAMAGGLTAIVCVGETLEEREREETFVVLDRQIREGLNALPPGFVVAYEPVWAIGTGRNATSAQAQEAHAHIRRRLHETFGAGVAAACRLLYGGSVKPDNIRELSGQPDVDGALVGGASLEAKSFAAIVTGSRAAAV